MSNTSAGIRVWDGTEAASIHGASSALAVSINTKIVGDFADEAARNAAYQSYTSQQKRAIWCWVESRRNYSSWDPTLGDWVWAPVGRVLYSQVLAHSVTPNTETGLLGTGSLVLPPGNRRVRISVGTLAVNGNSNNNCYHKVQLSGNGISGDYGLLAGLTVTGGGQVSLARTWNIVAAGTISYDLTGRVSGPANTYYFEGTEMSVTDMGAS